LITKTLPGVVMVLPLDMNMESGPIVLKINIEKKKRQRLNRTKRKKPLKPVQTHLCQETYVNS
jgi:hypothetical protein